MRLEDQTLSLGELTIVEVEAIVDLVIVSENPGPWTVGREAKDFQDPNRHVEWM